MQSKRQRQWLRKKGQHQIQTFAAAKAGKDFFQGCNSSSHVAEPTELTIPIQGHTQNVHSGNVEAAQFEYYSQELKSMTDEES